MVLKKMMVKINDDSENNVDDVDELVSDGDSSDVEDAYECNDDDA